jgi:hypothetical protein
MGRKREGKERVKDIVVMFNVLCFVIPRLIFNENFKTPIYVPCVSVQHLFYIG